jgi:hypothetical protein
VAIEKLAGSRKFMCVNSSIFSRQKHEQYIYQPIQVDKMKLNHFLIGVAILSSSLGIAIAPASAGKVFSMPSFDGRYVDLCATSKNGTPSQQCKQDQRAQEIVTDAFCRQIGMTSSVRWTYTKDSWRNRKAVWKLSQRVEETWIAGYSVDDPNNYRIWVPAEGSHYYTMIECQ